MKYRSKRAELELILEGLATVQPFAQEVSAARPLFGWWITPTVEPIEGCSCELCGAKEAGRDVHLGNVFRLAVHRAATLAEKHRQAAAA